MSLESITDRIRTKVGSDSGLGATIKFALDNGNIFVDGSSVPNVVSNEDKAADCTIRISSDDIQKIMDGELNGMTAFMMGKIKVEGNMGIAMNLNKVL